jgi:hypothetical protein
MRDIKVATDDGGAYYDIVSRLKKTHLRFLSVSPVEAQKHRQSLVLTSKKETVLFNGDAVAIEELDRDPMIMKGQLLSHMIAESRRTLLVGIDPGSKIGVVVFYGGRELGAFTTSSVDGCVDVLVAAAKLVPHTSLSVKIGGGAPKTSAALVSLLRERLPAKSLIEVVDESGTTRAPGAVGTTKDERAAARIAYRKGVRVPSKPQGGTPESSPRDARVRTPP